MAVRARPPGPLENLHFAIPQLKPGDTLVLRDGTYTSATSGYAKIYCGSNATQGTAAQRITLKAEHERQAFLKGDGSAYPVQMIGCAYWTLQGLRAEGGGFEELPPWPTAIPSRSMTPSILPSGATWWASTTAIKMAPSSRSVAPPMR